MLSPRGRRHTLRGAALLAVIGLSVLVWGGYEPSAETVRIDAVTVDRDDAGELSMTVAGQGLHDGLRALLMPVGYDNAEKDSRPELATALYHLETDGRFAVATTIDRRVVTLDVTAGRPVRVLGGIKPSPVREDISLFTISGIALVGSMAVVSRNHIGLLLIDMSDPAMPREIDRIESPSVFSDLDSAGRTVFVASKSSGLTLVTIKGQQLRFRDVPDSRETWRLATNGQLLVTATLGGQLTLYDVDPQGDVHAAGQLQLSKAVRDIAIAGRNLYVCTADGRLLGYSLAAWPRLTLSGQLDLQGRPMRLEADPEGNRLFCTLVGKGIGIIDIGRPSLPQLAGLISMPRTAFDLKCREGRLITVGIDGLRVFQGDELKHLSLGPEIVHLFDTADGKVRLFPWHGKVLAYNNRELKEPFAGGVPEDGSSRDQPFLLLPDWGGVRQHPLRNGLPEWQPERRIPLDDLSATRQGFDRDMVRKTDWYAGRWYVLGNSKVQILSAEPDGTVALSGEYQIKGEGIAMTWLPPRYLAVACRDNAVCWFDVLDVETPSRVRRIATCTMPKHQWTVGDIRDLLSDGKSLFVSRSRLGVEIFDMSEPTVPKLVQRIETPGSAGKMSLDNGLLVVGDQGEGLFFIDTEGEFGIPVGSHPLPVIAGEILNDHGQIYLVTSASGILRFPSPRRLVPQKRSSDRTLELATAEAVPPGRYLLTLYDGDDNAEFPVVLQ